jgi:hypothetical protein
VDGPKHDDDATTMDKDNDLICTSGGFRRCENEGSHKRLWVLDYWTEEKAISWLVASQFQAGASSGSRRTKSHARDVHSLCEGIISDLLAACGSPIPIARRLRRLVQELSVERVQFALTSTERTEDEKNPYRLRTKFELREEEIGDG